MILMSTLSMLQTALLKSINNLSFKFCIQSEDIKVVSAIIHKTWIFKFEMILMSTLFTLQTILKDVCYENIDCILKLLDESGAENSTVVVLKKTERSFKGKCCIAVF